MVNSCHIQTLTLVEYGDLLSCNSIIFGNITLLVILLIVWFTLFGQW